MRRNPLVHVVAVIALAGGLFGSGTTPAVAAFEGSVASAALQISDALGALTAVGTVSFQQEAGKVVVRVDIPPNIALTPGLHGMHVHDVGSCAGPAFTSAGGHYNPGGVGHGSHAGDMPSLLVLDDGTAMAEFATDRFAIADLFDADGSAIIVHAAPDNFANIPTRYQSTTEGVFGPDSATLGTGDAGARAACGVVD